MISCKCFFDFNKEEAWLTSMTRQGYKLIKASPGYYKFDKISDQLGEVIYRIDYRTFSKNDDFVNYCTMFEDSGWLHIAGTRHSGSQYFVKMRPDASDDIFSDNLSRAGRYKRISYMWFSLLIPYTMYFISISLLLRNDGNLYLTPGLWDMKGLQFILAFLFETPFALMRLLPGIGFVFLIVYYLYYAIKSYKLYKKELKSSI